MTSFNVMCKGTKRYLTQLKSQWGVLKMNVKKDKAAQRRELFKTGGGPSTSSAPPTDSGDIESWLPAEFLVDTNEFDSDSNYKIVEKENIKTTTNPSSQTLAPVFVKLQQIVENKNEKAKPKYGFASSQVQNEERKARNLDIKYELLKEKLIYYKNLNHKAAEDNP